VHCGVSGACGFESHRPDQFLKRKKMSYHDHLPDYMRTGIAVVNPLIRIERKLKRIQDVLNNISAASTLTAVDLKIKIQQAMAEEDVK